MQENITERIVFKSELDLLIEDAVNKEQWIIYVQFLGRECPNCELLEKFLTINGIEHQPINIRTPEAATEMAFRGCMPKNGSVLEACIPKFTPVLQRGKTVFYRELWQEHGKTLDFDRIKQLIDPNKSEWVDVVKTHECKDGVCSL